MEVDPSEVQQAQHDEQSASPASKLVSYDDDADSVEEVFFEVPASPPKATTADVEVEEEVKEEAEEEREREAPAENAAAPSSISEPWEMLDDEEHHQPETLADKADERFVNELTLLAALGFKDKEVLLPLLAEHVGPHLGGAESEQQGGMRKVLTCLLLPQGAAQ